MADADNGLTDRADDTEDQYDVIGELYERTKHIPVGLAEEASLAAALPDLTGKAVLDVGSGTGYYPRLFSRLGAARVVGVDAAAEMVRHAQSVEDRDPLGITYQRHDAAKLPVLGGFDVVTAVWLLGYAEGETNLVTMAGKLRANLAAGGTLVAVFPNPDADLDALGDDYAPYGLTCVKTEVVSGRRGVIMHVDGEPPIDFESFFWAPGVVDKALEKAGFTDVERQPVVVPEDALAEHGATFWAGLLANPTFAVLTARAGS